MKTLLLVPLLILVLALVLVDGRSDNNNTTNAEVISQGSHVTDQAGTAP